MRSVKGIDKICRDCLHHMTTPHHANAIATTVYTSSIKEYECYRYQCNIIEVK